MNAAQLQEQFAAFAQAHNAQPVRLNIGAGDVEVAGFTPVDRKLGHEAYPLRYADNSVDEIRASHVLEHFDQETGPKVLADWVRVLKPGGRIRIAVPDFAYIAKAYLEQAEDKRRLFAYMMGGQTDRNDHHGAAFDEPLLRALMRRSGLENIRHWQSEVQDCAALPVSLNLEGTKKTPRAVVDVPKIVGVMSTSKLGFTENLFCAMQHLHSRGIEIIKHTGAFWGQCIERVMERAVEDGAEWIVTLDYDTVFTGEIFEELCYLMATNPDVDALAPWQCKRECDDPLVWMTDENGDQITEIPFEDLEKPLLQVDTAHFGLTLLRAESLKRMAHPWFWSQPNSEGTWGEAHVDDDIYFWHKWKEAGNTLFMANAVSIGHLQQVATWPGRNFRAVHQYVTDFQKYGMPQECRR